MKLAQPIARGNGSVYPMQFGGLAGFHGDARRCTINGDLGQVEPPSMDALTRLATLGAISAGVAHDLGNLLQIISSGLRLIDRNLRDCTGEDVRPFCEVALAAVDRAAALRLQILQQARSRAALSPRVDLGAALENIRGLIELTAGPDIHVEVATPDDIVQAHCDLQGLENVILNLVVNARDAMPLGGHLKIEAVGSDTWIDRGAILLGPNSAVLRVTDTGCGMSAETLAEASKPFFTTKGHGRGTGLGLSLAFDFARRWGGAAEIDSTLGEGTSFTLWLPTCPD